MTILLTVALGGIAFKLLMLRTTPAYALTTQSMAGRAWPPSMLQQQPPEQGSEAYQLQTSNAGSFKGHAAGLTSISIMQQQQQQGGLATLPSPADGVTSIRPFVGVLSSPGNFHARQIIRSTWGADKRVSRLMFFTLRPQSSLHFKQLRREAADLGDLVVTAEVLTHYHNITYSTYEIFKTAARIGGFTHVFKADDDSYFRWNLLLPALESLPTEWLYAGYPMKSEQIRRTGKHGVTHQYNWPFPRTPPYAYGWGYVVSMDIAKEIAAGAPLALMEPGRLLPLEDVSVGFWVDYIRQDREVNINYRVLQAERTDRKCTEKSLVVHLKPTTGTPWDMMLCMFHTEGHCCHCTQTGCFPVSRG